jgi:hypothetical protein
MKWMGLVIAMFMLGCPAPHGPAIPALPSKGGPAWVEVTSPHFIVWTDSSEARGRVLAQQMEDYRRIVVGVLFAGGEPNSPPTLVLALRDAEEVGAYVPKQFIAYASGGGPLRQPVIILAADTSDDNNHIVIHELTHAITFGVIADQPKWFAEGLAGFFETTRLRADSGVVDIGHPQDYIAARLRGPGLGPDPTAALIACDHPSCMDDMFYATTWATFSFLVSTRTEALIRYMQRLAAIAPGAPARASELAAWNEVFPDLPPAQLDQALATWLHSGKQLLIHYPFKSEQVVAAARPLGDTDALAARAIMQWIFAPTGAETRTAVDAALAADRTQVLVRLIDMQIMGSIEVDDARAVAIAHPNDWRAWLLVGSAVRTGPEAREAHDKLCALIGTDHPIGMPRELCSR